jgi:methionyl-tRNA formyltransferase
MLYVKSPQQYSHHLTTKPVPISHTSASLALPTHIIDTFTGWTPPPTNLIIAVSFGLLVPRRILGLAKHGGINVHPSLLPDLRGAAPIEHALLKQRDCTGVSVQTLHPTQFDHGVVVAPSPPPGLRNTRDSRFADLHDELAAAGAEMLVDVLKTRKYVAPHRDAGWYAGPVDLAPKISPQDRFVDFGARTMDEVLAMQRALGNTWCVLPNGHRVIMHKVTEAGVLDAQGHAPGMWMQEGSENPTLRMACGGLGTLLESTYAGGKKGLGNAKLKMVLPWREAHHDEYKVM